MHFLPLWYWEPNYARELYTCPSYLWYLRLPSPTPAWQCVFCLTCHLNENRICPLFSQFVPPVRAEEMVSFALVMPYEQPGCSWLPGRNTRAAALQPGPSIQVPVGKAVRQRHQSVQVPPGKRRTILAVEPQKRAPCLWPSPQQSVLWHLKPELTFSPAAAEDGPSCRACAIAEWITHGKGSKRERQPQCRKCFVHQLPPILHPERLKAVCLQLCVMSCSVCHFNSSPGIIRHA